MKFIKDLLFFEINTTGSDPDKDSIIQLSAILLDRDNLLEKAFVNYYIKVTYLEGIIAQHAQLLGIDFEVLQSSPKVYDAIKRFKDKFGSNIILATHNVRNVLFLRNAFKKAVVPFEYDYHILELWTLEYVYMLNQGLRKMPTLQTLLDHFRLKQQRPQDALEKIRLEAEIFRKIVKTV